MKEALLRDYFLGGITANDLLADVKDSVMRDGILSVQEIEDMTGDFALKPEHLVKLCSDVLAGRLPPKTLEEIGFCLVASDRFNWNSDTPEGERVAEVAHDWSAPEINFPLTLENVAKWRDYLTTGDTKFPPKQSPQ
jgi:hypothetical protein